MGEDGLGYRYVTGPKKADAIRGKFYSGVPLERLEDVKKGISTKTRPISNYYNYSGDFGNIRQEGGVPFNSGKKPVKMLKELINYHQSKNAVVLDFFAGSGSTGQAVLELNMPLKDTSSKLSKKLTAPPYLASLLMKSPLKVIL